MSRLAPNSMHARDIAHFLHPQTNLVAHEQEGPTIITRGKGIYVYDDQGREYLEGAAGLWCASLGFASERLAKVAYEQMRTLGFSHTFRHVSNEAGIDLAEKLIQIAPVPMSKVLFQCSGSEANDTAIKLAWYYHSAIGKPRKTKIIGRKMGYHGSTCAAISASGKPEMHADFNLPLASFLHTEFPHYYRYHEEGESEAEFATRMADALEALILREGPETVAAFIAEPIQGAGGAVLPPEGYFAKVQAVLREYEILFIADEVICGFGRTGNMWGSETFRLKPDMITCAKALSAGMQPISALLLNEKIYQAMLEESRKIGSFAHGMTYSGHPVTTAVARETLRIYDEMDLVGHVKRVGPVMQKALSRFADHPLVGDVRGIGLIAGIDIVADKKARTPHEAALKVPAIFERNAKKHSLILRFIRNRVAFSPPLIITEDEIGELVRRFGRALDDTQAELSGA
ncbi:MAG TPA: aminotransferase [Alphaproteobacteria bacterium]|nr:aminotransferase [Alphaproteobacteria bacterium]